MMVGVAKARRRRLRQDAAAAVEDAGGSGI